MTTAPGSNNDPDRPGDTDPRGRRRRRRAQPVGGHPGRQRPPERHRLPDAGRLAIILKTLIAGRWS